MEKVTTRKTIIKTVEEEVEMDIFISKDGTISNTEEEALKQDDQIDFIEYFNKKYKLVEIDPQEYGVNFGHTSFCHLVYIKKLTDEIIDEFIRFYNLEDHPDDLIKIKEGWSFVALVNDVNLWVFDQIDRMFIVEKLDDIIKNKKKEIELLLKLI